MAGAGIQAGVSGKDDGIEEFLGDSGDAGEVGAAEWFGYFTGFGEFAFALYTCSLSSEKSHPTLDWTSSFFFNTLIYV